MKRITSLLLILVLLSCQKKFFVENTEAAISKLAFTEMIYELEVDENDQIMDTLSYEMRKRDKQNNIRYKRQRSYILKDRVLDVEAYYAKDKTIFLHKIQDSSGEINSTYKAVLGKKNEIIRAVQLDTTATKEVITTKISFEYQYGKGGRIKNSVGTYTQEGITEKVVLATYNDQEQVVREEVVVGGDTISVEELAYLGSTLTSSIFTQKMNDWEMKTILSFDKNGNQVKSEEYYKEKDEFTKVRETTITYNDKAQKVSATELDLESNEVRRIRYVYTPKT